MKKLYFRTKGQEPDEVCIDVCPYKNRPTKTTKIGSCSCQGCNECYGWDSEENWVKCLRYAVDKEEDKGDKEEVVKKFSVTGWLKKYLGFGWSQTS